MTAWPGDRRRSAFTLVELLLVVVITLITTGLAIPLFAKSFHQNRLRSAARVVIASHRYARAISVLRQMDVALLVEQEYGRITVVSLRPPETESESGLTAETGTSFTPGGTEAYTPSWATASSSEVNSNLPPDVILELRRELPEKVFIAEVEMANDEQRFDQSWWVNYYPNGMCDEYRVRLEDDRGQGMTVIINPLSGEAAVEEE